MLNKRILPVLILGCAICPAHQPHAQQLTDLPLYRQFNLTNWNLDDGVPPNVHVITQTADGFLWLGTDDGVVQFDGIHFLPIRPDTLVKPVGDVCSAIRASADQTLFLGYADGKVLAYRQGSSRVVGNKELFGKHRISAFLEEPDSSLWIGLQGGGLVHCKDGRYSRITAADGLPSNYITALRSGTGGEIWVGTQEGLCSLFHGKVDKVFQKDGLSHNFILSLYMDRTNRLWIGTHGGLNYLDDGQIRNVSNHGLSSDIDIFCIDEDPGGNIWIGVHGDGLFRISANGEKVDKISDKEGLPSNQILSLLVDKESNIWVGFQGNFGLCCLQHPVIQTYGMADGLSDENILPILTAGASSAWIGNATGGIDLFSQGRFTQFGPVINVGNKPIYSLALDKQQNLWIGTLGNPLVFRSPSQVKEVPVPGVKDSGVYALYFARDGSLWMGTDNGITVLRGDSVDVITEKEGLSNDQVLCFHEDSKGIMWVGTQHGGINKIQNGRIISFTVKEGLKDNMVLCILEDDSGFLWVGTRAGGLSRIDIGSGKIHSFGLQEGLDYCITQIFQDRYGYLWLGTGRGILSIPLDQFDEMMAGNRSQLEPQIFDFSGKDKTMSVNGGIFPAGGQFEDGILWFPTNHGIAVIVPEHTHGKNRFPQAVIQQVEVNNAIQQLSPGYTLPPAVIHLSVKFTAPAFISPASIKFRYRLVGYDKDWELAGVNRRAHYTKVPHGSYTFQLQVSNHFGQWSDQIISLPIKIQPYFYQRTWFLVICVAIGVLILYAFYKYRIRQIREKELVVLVEKRTAELRELNRELDKRVLDRTAELAASNQELEAFSYSVSHDLRAPVRRIDGLLAAVMEDYAPQLDQAGQDYLKKIAESATEMNELIEEFLKLSRIARQEIDKSEVNLSELASELISELERSDPGRQVKSMIQPGMVTPADPHLIRIALLNMLGNAWKYTAKNPSAKIEFGDRQNDGQRIFFIRDNGVGFDMGHYEKLFTPFLRLHSDDQFTGTGIGLATVKRIIAKHGGKIWAQAEPGQGSTFFFTL